MRRDGGRHDELRGVVHAQLEAGPSEPIVPTNEEIEPSINIKIPEPSIEPKIPLKHGAGDYFTTTFDF